MKSKKFKLPAMGRVLIGAFMVPNLLFAAGPTDQAIRIFSSTYQPLSPSQVVLPVLTELTQV